MEETLYSVKKQIGNRIFTLREDGEWTYGKHFTPWLGDKQEALKKMKLRQNIESYQRPKPRYYIESTEWEELHL